MIISYEHRATVLRVPKTGSTSLEIALRMAGCFTSPTDVYSDIMEAQMPSRNEPQGFIDWKDQLMEIRRSIRIKERAQKDTGRLAVFTDEERRERDRIYGKDENGIYVPSSLHHATLDNVGPDSSLEFARLLDREAIETWDHYAFVRNPYERILSAFTFITRIRNPVDEFQLENFKRLVMDDDVMQALVYRPQSVFFSYKGAFCATPLLYENYEAEVRKLIDRFGGVQLAELPRYKDSKHLNELMGRQTPSPDDWIYSEPAIHQRLADFYAEDIALWEQVSGKQLPKP